MSQDVEIGAGGRREQDLGEVARQQPEQAGSESQAGHDLSHDGRLPDPRGEFGENEGHREYQSDVHQDRADDRLGGFGSSDIHGTPF
ncbi:hypothetical protein [Streptomyces sp.]|uniref:hypothetical protein n=1 Tax=Streptomyces sp. TaxID=1931 RepID=UPI0039C9248C